MAAQPASSRQAMLPKDPVESVLTELDASGSLSASVVVFVTVSICTSITSTVISLPVMAFKLDAMSDGEGA